MAAAYAYRDAKIDHCEDGLWAAMFLSALGSAAFFIADPIRSAHHRARHDPAHLPYRPRRQDRASPPGSARQAGWLEARESGAARDRQQRLHRSVPRTWGSSRSGCSMGAATSAAALGAAVNCGCDSETVGGALGARVTSASVRPRPPAERVRISADRRPLRTGISATTCATSTRRRPSRS